MELTEVVKELLMETAKALKGSARRMFLVRTVKALGEGGQRLAERELGWNRGTIRKGLQELEHGIVYIDAFSSRGRKRSEELFLSGVTSKVTSDCLVDRLVDWWETVKERFSHIKMLLINLDNGPENHSRRTQFMQHLVDFVQHYRITIRLAYYPTYHSKYNAIERCWGILEQHWNGALLDSVDTVVQYARTMTWKGKHPVVALVTTTYQTGVKLSKETMKVVETQLERMPHLDRWFVDIVYPSPAIRDS